MAKSIDDEIAFRAWLGARLAGAGWFLLIAGFLLALPVLMGLSPTLILVVVAVAAVLAAAWVLLRRRWSTTAATRAPGPQWLRAAAILTGVVGILAAAPIYLMAIVSETRPVMMPQVVLSDGTRTLIFQGMVHVGSEGFYKSVVYDLERAGADGYTMFFEGVRPSTPEADRWFTETLAGGGDLSASYDAVAGACGLKFQSTYFEFLAPEIEAEPDRYVAADVTTADLRAEAERLSAEDPDFAEALGQVAAEMAASGAGALDRFVALQNSGTEGQKEIAGIVCRGVMSLVHGGGTGEVSLGALEPIILDYRNRALAERILASDAERIFVTYGAGHLPGVIELLEAADPPWQVESVKWVRAIAPPDDFEADLKARVHAWTPVPNH